MALYCLTVAKGQLTASLGCPHLTARIPPAVLLFNYMFGASHKICHCVPIFAKIGQIQCVCKAAVHLGYGTVRVQACIDARGHHYQHLL
jgi:hypothetical protein